MPEPRPGDTGLIDLTPDNCVGCDRCPAEPGSAYCAPCRAQRQAGPVPDDQAAPARPTVVVPQIDRDEIRRRVRAALARR